MKSLQQKLWEERAGISEQQIWESILEESSDYDASDVNFVLDLYEELKDIVEALPKAAYVSAMRSATDPEGEGDGGEKVVARARKNHGEKFAKDLESGAGKMHFPRDNHSSGVFGDRLAGFPTKVTKSGKANKQSVNALKNRIRDRISK